MTLALDQTRTYHFDGLGSTIKLTDGSGVITDTFSYDAWGNVTRVSGSTSDNPYLYVGRLGYYTHYQEPSMNPLDQTSGTKLLQLGVRYYNPEIGRFTQRDPACSTASTYGYADGSPTRYTDSLGLAPEDVSKDPALNKCLSRIRKCFPEYSCTIDKVAEWYVDDMSEGTWGFIHWEDHGKGGKMVFCQGYGDLYVPNVDWRPHIGLQKGSRWRYRYDSPVDFHVMCSDLLHEIVHASHGRCGTAWDNLKERLGWADQFHERVEDMYYKHGSCMTNGRIGDLPWGK